MKIKKFLSLVLSFFLIGSLIAQVDILSPKEFVAMTKTETDLVILDASKSKNYKASHIKNAISVDYNDLHKEGDLKGVLKSPQTVADYFCNLGIGENTKVVVYDEGSQKYSSRIYWTLKYIGKDHVYLLHKDLSKWRSARIMLTSASTQLEPASLTANVDPSLIISMGDIKARKGNADFVLVDVRTPDEFKGLIKSEGHIPGAINLNHEDLLTDNGAFKPVEELQKIAIENGLTKDKEIAFYCKTSVRAAVSFIAFKNLLGYENIKVYDGAYNEWVLNHSVVQ